MPKCPLTGFAQTGWQRFVRCLGRGQRLRQPDEILRLQEIVYNIRPASHTEEKTMARSGRRGNLYELVLPAARAERVVKLVRDFGPEGSIVRRINPQHGDPRVFAEAAKRRDQFAWIAHVKVRAHASATRKTDGCHQTER